MWRPRSLLWLLAVLACMLWPLLRARAVLIPVMVQAATPTSTPGPSQTATATSASTATFTMSRTATTTRTTTSTFTRTATPTITPTGPGFTPTATAQPQVIYNRGGGISANAALMPGQIARALDTKNVGLKAPAADVVMIGDGTTWKDRTIPSCHGASDALTYDPITDGLGCNTITGSGGGGISGLTGDSGGTTVGDPVTVAGDGAGIDTAVLLDTLTITFNSTKVAAKTWGSGSGFAWTYDASGGTDPVLTLGNGTFNLSTGTLQQGGTAVVLQSRTLTGTAPITIDGGASGDLSANRTIACIAATGSVAGCLAAADWTTFNAKQAGPLISDVTTSGTTATIAASAVTLTKMANETASTLLGNSTGSPAAPQALSVATVKTLLAIANTDVSGLGTMSTQNASSVAVTGGTEAGLTGLAIRDTSAAFDVTLAATSTSPVLSAGRTLTFDVGNAARTLKLTGNATEQGTNTGDQTITLQGDVTGTGTGTFTTTIATDAVTSAKILDGTIAPADLDLTATYTYTGKIRREHPTLREQ